MNAKKVQQQQEEEEEEEEEEPSWEWHTKYVKSLSFSVM